MTILSELKASWGFVERNFNLVKRYLAWEIVFLVYNLVNAITIGLIAYSETDPIVRQQKALYLLIGALLWGFLGVLFHAVSESVSWERWEGTIEYTFMAPVRRLTHLMGQCLFAVLYGLVRTVLILMVLSLFFDLNFGDVDFFAAGVVAVIASFSFMGLGLMAAVLPLMSPERGTQASHILQALILLVSGVYYEISVLPGWIRPLSYISPGTYTLRSIREILLHGKSFGDIKFDILILIVIGLVSIPLGLLVFNLAEQHAKKVGKLKRSG